MLNLWQKKEIFFQIWHDILLHLIFTWPLDNYEFSDLITRYWLKSKIIFFQGVGSNLKGFLAGVGRSYTYLKSWQGNKKDYGFFMSNFVLSDINKAIINRFVRHQRLTVVLLESDGLRHVRRIVVITNPDVKILMVRLQKTRHAKR